MASLDVTESKESSFWYVSIVTRVALKESPLSERGSSGRSPDANPRHLNATVTCQRQSLPSVLSILFIQIDPS
jgi:hypothetical protein